MTYLLYYLSALDLFTRMGALPKINKLMLRVVEILVN